MVPKDCRYTKEHEWVRLEGDEAWIGITDYAQGALGDIVYVELPSVGAGLSQGQTFGSVEAVKAVSDLFSPISGTVTAVNDALASDPPVVNREPHGAGWMIRARLSKPAEMDGLLTPDDYDALVASLEAGH